jgi:hypothetical protein
VVTASVTNIAAMATSTPRSSRTWLDVSPAPAIMTWRRPSIAHATGRIRATGWRSAGSRSIGQPRMTEPTGAI